MGKKYAETDSGEFDVGGDRQDELFAVLSHPRRRFVLQYLQSAETPRSLDDVLTELVAWEVERPVSDRSGGNRSDIELSLLHKHLPKMNECGVVDFDETERTVALADGTGDVQSQLRAMSSD